MPQNRNSAKPPEVMTRGEAALVIVAAVVVDLLRGFFQLFWFFGPALAALYCENTVSGWVGSLWGLTEVACDAGAVVAGSAASAVTAPFGVVMAIAVGLFGFLAIGLWIAVTNKRLLKTVEGAPLQFAGAFAVGEIPFLGAFPVFTVILWKLYATQIKVEKAALKKWEKEHAAARQQERERQAQAAALMRMQQEAANDEAYGQIDAANDESYDETPEETRRAA